MSFSANAIGFYLEVEDRLTPTLAKAKKSYTDFATAITVANKNATTSADKALKSLGKSASLFSGLSVTAVKEYDAAMQAIQRRIKPIYQPVEFTFGKPGTKGGGSLAEMVSKSVAEALGSGSFRLHAAVPNRRSRGFDNSNLSQRFQKTMQPPDYLGKFEFGAVKKFHDGGRVPGKTGADVVTIAKANELYINKRSEDFIAGALKNITKMVGNIAERRGETGSDITALQERVRRGLTMSRSRKPFLSEFGSAFEHTEHLAELGHKVESDPSAGVTSANLARDAQLAAASAREMRKAYKDLAPELRSSLLPVLNEMRTKVDDATKAAEEFSASISPSGGAGGGGKPPRRRAGGRGRGGRGGGGRGGGGLGPAGTALAMGENINRLAMGIYGVTAGGIDSQSALAEAMAQQFGQEVQAGRVTAHGFFSGLARHGVTAQEAFGALNAGRIQGFRGAELTGDMMRTAALSARASGADVGALTDQAATLRNRFNLSSGQVSTILNEQRKGWQNAGIFGGIAVQNTGQYLEAAEITASRMGSQQSANYVGGLHKAYNRLAQRSVFGSDSRGQAMAGHLMTVVANAGWDQNAASALYQMGVSPESLDYFKRTGDPGQVLAKIRDYSARMGGNIPTQALIRLSSMLGMSPQELNAILVRARNISNNDPLGGAADTAEAAAYRATPLPRFATIGMELAGSTLEMQSRGLISGESLGAVNNLLYLGGSALQAYGAYKGIRGLFGGGAGAARAAAGGGLSAATIARHGAQYGKNGKLLTGGALAQRIQALERARPAAGWAGAAGRRVGAARNWLAGSRAGRVFSGMRGKGLPLLGTALGVGTSLYDAYQSYQEGNGYGVAGGVTEAAGWGGLGALEMGGVGLASTAGLVAAPLLIGTKYMTNQWERQSQDTFGTMDTLRSYLDEDNGKQIAGGHLSRLGERVGASTWSDWALAPFANTSGIWNESGPGRTVNGRAGTRTVDMGANTMALEGRLSEVQHAVNNMLGWKTPEATALNKKLADIVHSGQSYSDMNESFHKALKEGVGEQYQKEKESVDQLNDDKAAQLKDPSYRIEVQQLNVLKDIATTLMGGGGGLRIDR